MCAKIARTGAPDDSTAVRALIDGVDIFMEMIPSHSGTKGNRLA